MDADRIVAAQLVGGDTACISLDGEAFIKAWEGCRLDPYLDVGGRLTVGYGHLLLDTDPHESLTQDEADSLFIVDAQRIAEGVAGLVSMPVRQYQFDALCDFAFNLGLGALAASTLRQKVNGGDIPAAADQFVLWCKARDPATGELVVNRGLAARRWAERAMFLSADYSGRP